MDPGVTRSTLMLLKSALDTEVREGSHSFGKSQVCNLILQLLQPCQLKLFRLINLGVLMINLTIRTCVKIRRFKHLKIPCDYSFAESEYVCVEPDNMKTG